jgi:predicted nucleic acid-binding protein
MAFKIFLDANTLLDLTLKRQQYPQARRLLESTIEGKLQSFTTSSIIQVVSYWLAATYGTDRARDLLLALLAEVRVIDISHEIALNALHSKMGNMEDALLYYTALHHKLDYFITRDLRLREGALPALPVCSPEEFLVYNFI